MAKKHKNANKPVALNKESVPAEDVEKEKHIIIAQIKEDPKNANKPEVEVVVEEAELEVEAVIEPEVDAPITIPGMVIGCGKLNVRKEPKPTAAIVCEIMGNTELVINVNESTEDFYKIHTAAGVEGFCMKKFIETHE